MSGRRTLLVFAAFLAFLAALTWTAMVALQTPFSGTRSERAAVEAALARLGVSERSWRTMSAGVSVTRPVPVSAAYSALVRLDRFTEWNGTAEAVLLSDDGGERVCRLFRLQEAGEGRTTVVAAEVRHGTVSGLSSPFVRSRLTRRLRASVVGLLASAAQGGPPRP